VNIKCTIFVSALTLPGFKLVQIYSFPPQQDENIEEEKEDKTKVREVRELLVTNTPNQGILLRREEALLKLHV